MKYAIIICWFVIAGYYIVGQTIIILVLNLLYFLWDFKIKKEYIPYNKVIIYLFIGSLYFDSLNDFFKLKNGKFA